MIRSKGGGAQIRGSHVSAERNTRSDDLAELRSRPFGGLFLSDSCPSEGPVLGLSAPGSCSDTAASMAASGFYRLRFDWFPPAASADRRGGPALKRSQVSVGIELNRERTTAF